MNMITDIQFQKHHFPGRLVTVCGTDGAGKTTLIKMLVGHLERSGQKVLLTKQPTDEARAMRVFRKYLFEPENRADVDYQAFLATLIGDRLQHIHEVIRPALKRGEIVVSDRYIYTQIVTTRTRGHDDEPWMYALYKRIIDPDVKVLLDVPLEVATSRISARNGFEESFLEIDHVRKNQEVFRQVAEEMGLEIIDSSSPNVQISFNMLRDLVDKILP